MSWKKITPKEIIVLDREEHSPEVWAVYTKLFCASNDVDVIHVDINHIEYFDNEN